MKTQAKQHKAQGAGEVRIIGGVWKRTKLPVMNVNDLRPTPSRVRETLFNWLGQDLSGWRCLDVFAGSGALGFEAASRGAAYVKLVEKEKKIFLNLKTMQNKLNATQIEVLYSDGMSELNNSAPESYDLIFIDPPFGADLFDEALIAAQKVISPSGAIYLEAARVIEAPLGLSCYKQARAGAVYYYLFTKTM